MTGMTISAPQIPMDTLTEHLDYFNDNVAGEIQFSVAHFDDIFHNDKSLLEDDAINAPALVYTSQPDINFDEPWELQQPAMKKHKKSDSAACTATTTTSSSMTIKQVDEPLMYSKMHPIQHDDHHQKQQMNKQHKTSSNQHLLPVPDHVPTTFMLPTPTPVMTTTTPPLPGALSSLSGSGSAGNAAATAGGGSGIKHSFQHLYSICDEALSFSGGTNVKKPTGFQAPPLPVFHKKPTTGTTLPSSPRSIKNTIKSSRDMDMPSPTSVMMHQEFMQQQQQPGTTTTTTMTAAPTPPVVTTPFTSRSTYMPSSTGRKRSPSIVSSSFSITKTSSYKKKNEILTKVEEQEEQEPIDTTGMSLEELEKLRRERNRAHAKKSRQRKRNYMSQLEEAVNEMRIENERLCSLLGVDSTSAKTALAQEDIRRQEESTEKFIKHLTRPSNRMLDNTTLSFLRELWR